MQIQINENGIMLFMIKYTGCKQAMKIGNTIENIYNVYTTGKTFNLDLILDGLKK